MGDCFKFCGLLRKPELYKPGLGQIRHPGMQRTRAISICHAKYGSEFLLFYKCFSCSLTQFEQPKPFVPVGLVDFHINYLHMPPLTRAYSDLPNKRALPNR